MATDTTTTDSTVNCTTLTPELVTKAAKASCFISSVATEQGYVEDPEGNLKPTWDKLTELFGWVIVGDFATGATIDARSQMMQDASGDTWRYTGTLPVTVAAGTTPSAPDWVKEDVSPNRERIYELTGIYSVPDKLSAASLGPLPTDTLVNITSKDGGLFKYVTSSECVDTSNNLSGLFINVSGTAGLERVYNVDASTDWFDSGTDDLGQVINDAQAQLKDGDRLHISRDRWYNDTYSVGIISNTRVSLVFPSVNNSGAETGTYDGSGYGITTTGQNTKIEGGLKLTATHPDGVPMAVQGTDAIINDLVELYGGKYSLVFGGSTAGVYGNTFTGRVRLSSATHGRLRHLVNTGADPSINSNRFNNLVISGSSASFPTMNITSIVQNGNDVVITASGHGYDVGDVVCIENVTPAEYNGHFYIDSVTNDTFMIRQLMTMPAYVSGGTSKFCPVGVNYYAGLGNSIGLYYAQDSAPNAFAGAFGDPAGNTIDSAVVDENMDNAFLADGGHVHINGGSDNSSNNSFRVNGGSVNDVHRAFNRPDLLSPRLVRCQNTQGMIQGSPGSSNVYSTEDSGGAEPFNRSGNHVIEGAADNTKGVYLKTGADGDTRMSVTGAGAIRFHGDHIRINTDDDEVRIIAGAGNPEGVVTAPKGSLFLRTDGAGAGLFLKSTTAANTGWIQK